MRRYLVQWQDTIGLHRYMLSIVPHSSSVHNSFGVSLTRMGRAEQALEHCRTALSLTPERTILHYNYAVALDQVPGRIDEAIKEYTKAIEGHSPYTPQATLSLGNLHLRKGELDKAIDQYRACLDIDEEFAGAYANLGKALLFAGLPEEGLRQLGEALRVNPGHILAMKSLAWFLATHPNEKIRDPNEAVTLAERIRDLTRGRDARVLDILAAAYACDEQYGRAIETAQRALTIARRVRDDELALDIEEHLRLYNMGVPYWEAPRVQLDRLVAKTKEREEQAKGAAVSPEF